MAPGSQDSQGPRNFRRIALQLHRPYQTSSVRDLLKTVSWGFSAIVFFEFYSSDSSHPDDSDVTLKQDCSPSPTDGLVEKTTCKILQSPNSLSCMSCTRCRSLRTKLTVSSLWAPLPLAYPVLKMHLIIFRSCWDHLETMLRSCWDHLSMFDLNMCSLWLSSVWTTGWRWWPYVNHLWSFFDRDLSNQEKLSQ